MLDTVEKLSGADAEQAKSIADFIEQASDDELFHIDMAGLSDGYHIERKDLLDIFIYGVKNGVFIMEWEYHCPYCGGIANEALTLHTATHEDYCDLCKVNFSNTLDNNIEVFFSIHPDVRVIPDKIKMNYKESMMESIQQSKMFDWKKNNTISGIEIIQNNTFREMMGDEVLAPDQSLEIMQSTLLFTDIKGSTQMYTKLGDAIAFRIVRDHFRILFDIIKKYNGVPVKTIGDAVMGVFINAQNGLTAALEIQKAIKNYSTDKNEDEKIALKIGVHSGSTIIVTLNGRLDYFGNSVNTAARIQAQALSDEVVVSEHIFKSKQSLALIKRYVTKVAKQEVPLKGLEGKASLYHINVVKNGV